MPQFRYPLSAAHLRLFANYFRQKYNQPLYYTSEQFIQSAFMEFAEVEGDDGTPEGGLNYVLDVVSIAEDCHLALRKQALYAKKAAGAEYPCTKCGQGGVLPTGVICPTCGGTGRRNRKSRQ